MLLNKWTTLIAALTLMLTACTSSTQGGTESLQDLQKLRAKTKSSKSNGLSAIRAEAITDTALSLAAQSSLAARSKQINKLLETQEKTLDQAFNFRGMLLDHNVLPPVLVESRDSLNLASNDSIRLADRTYQIASQARFVTTPPTWRDYLWMSYEKPTPPSDTLLPKDAKERELWQHNVNLGWNEGIIQADAIYAQNLARLRQDYAGIVLYRKLFEQNMVSAPYVAKTDLGITGGGSDIRIHDQVLRITAMPSLSSNSKKWKPAISP